MSITNIISLMGGLGAFLFGMKYMGDGLEMAAGSRMKDLLEKLTRNRFLGFLLGTFVTVVIQSSSATTVMVMGFINAGIMDLAQATGVIFGANIGTTITSVLIALDVSGIAPFCIFLGSFLMLYSKKKQTKYIGQVILGFGLLFQGLHTMSGAMKPLKDVVWFQNFIMNARNNAKRAAMIYLLYNVVGAVVMTLVTLLFPYAAFIERMIPVPAFQVSVIHIIFKVVAAVLLLPCTPLVVKLTYRLVPKQTHEDACRLEYIDVNLVGSPSVTLLQIRNEVERMSQLVRTNINLAMDCLLNRQLASAKRIEDNETTIDYLTDAISDFLVKLNVREMTDKDAQYVNHVFQALSDLERIGDYAELLLKQGERTMDSNLTYTQQATEELNGIYSNAMQLFDRAVQAFYEQNTRLDELKRMAKLQRDIRKQISQSQLNHMERMRAGECSTEAGIVFGEILNSLSRIGGHAINIAEAAVMPQENR